MIAQTASSAAGFSPLMDITEAPQVVPTTDIKLPPPPVLVPSTSTALPAPTTAVVISDDAAIAGLINMLLKRAGLTNAEAARRMGNSSQALSQYRRMRRTRPSIQWFARLAEICGARFYLEFPSRPL